MLCQRTEVVHVTVASWLCCWRSLYADDEIILNMTHLPLKNCHSLRKPKSPKMLTRYRHQSQSANTPVRRSDCDLDVRRLCPRSQHLEAVPPHRSLVWSACRHQSPRRRLHTPPPHPAHLSAPRTTSSTSNATQSRALPAAAGRKEPTTLCGFIGPEKRRLNDLPIDETTRLRAAAIVT